MPILNFNQVLTVLYILAGFFLADFLIYLFFKKVIAKMVKKTGTTLDNRVLEALERPVVSAIAFMGLYFSIKSLALPETIGKIIAVVFHSVLAALVIYAGAKVVAGILKWYETEIASKTRTGLDDRLIPLVRNGAFLIAAFLGIIWILDIVGLDLPWLKDWLVKHGTRMGFITALSLSLIFILSRLIPRALRPVITQRAKDRPEEEINKRVDTLSGVFVSATQVVIIFLASFMMLSEIGINIAPLLAGVGVAGLAIGFGAQSLIKDILNGLFIVLENQYGIGDVIKIADTAGLVEDMNLRRTVLRDLDGTVHSISNGEIRVASNFTREWSRVNLNISVAYGEDLDRVIEVINRVGQELAEDPAWAPLIIKPPQALRVDNLGDSGIEIKILGDTRPIQQWNVMGELRKRLKTAFDQEGIEIPWPHTKVYFGNYPDMSPLRDSKKAN